MVLLGTEISLFMVAFGLVGPLTFVPLFVSHLTDDPRAVGAVTAAFQLGWIPQLLVAGYVERTDRKWRWVQWFGGVERLPVLVLMLCALAAPAVGPPVVIVVYLACFAQSLCGGLATTPWMDVVARTVPAWLRGRFMGGFSMAGTLFGAAGAALAAPLLDSLPFPYGFAALLRAGVRDLHAEPGAAVLVSGAAGAAAEAAEAAAAAARRSSRRCCGAIRRSDGTCWGSHARRWGR